MGLQEIRLQWLKELLISQFDGNKAALARAIGKSPTQTRFYLNPEKPGGRWMGERMARAIEDKLGLPRGWLDREPNGTAPEAEVPLLLTPRQRALLGLFDGLTETQQDEVIRQVQERERENRAVVAELTARRKIK